MKNRYLVAIIALLLVLVLGASLVACENPADDNGETTTTLANDENDDPADTTTNAGGEDDTDDTTEGTTEEITEETETGLQGVTDVKDKGFGPVDEFVK